MAVCDCHDLLMRALALYVLLAACGGAGPTRAPTFRVPLLAGGELDFGSIVGTRPAVLIFWGTWCEPCVREAPLIVRAYERYGARVAFVAVSVDAPSEYGTLREMVARLRLPYPVGLDPEGGTAMALYTDHVPLVVVIDATGRIRRTFRSVHGDELERSIEDTAIGSRSR